MPKFLAVDEALQTRRNNPANGPAYPDKRRETRSDFECMYVLSQLTVGCNGHWVLSDEWLDTPHLRYDLLRVVERLFLLEEGLIVAETGGMVRFCGFEDCFRWEHFVPACPVFRPVGDRRGWLRSRADDFVCLPDLRSLKL